MHFPKEKSDQKSYLAVVLINHNQWPELWAFLHLEEVSLWVLMWMALLSRPKPPEWTSPAPPPPIEVQETWKQPSCIPNDPTITSTVSGGTVHLCLEEWPPEAQPYLYLGVLSLEAQPHLYLEERSLETQTQLHLEEEWLPELQASPAPRGGRGPSEAQATPASTAGKDG